MSPQDWMVVGGGIAAFLFSLLPFVGVSFGPFSGSVNAWHSYALLGILLLFATATLWALRLLEAVKLPDLPLPWARVFAIATAVGTLLVLLRGLTFSANAVSSMRNVGVSAGLRVGGVLLIVAGAVMTVGAVWAERTGPKGASPTNRAGPGGPGKGTPPEPAA